MRKVKKTLAFHFGEGRSARTIATHCGIARRSVMQTLERFAASGLSWPEAAGMDDAALEAALYPARRTRPADEGVDWAKVEEELSGRGAALKLLREEWRETNPGGMSYATWWRRFRDWRPRRDATMRQNRRPGERLFVDYAGMTVPLFLDGVERRAQVFVASMGVSGRACAEATLSQNIDDWCNSNIRCFEAMGRAPQAVVPDNIKAAVKRPSRYEPVLNETYADLLGHCGVPGQPARVGKPRDKGLVENGVPPVERQVPAPLRNHVFHDPASLNRAIAARVRKINRKPYADGAGENRFSRFDVSG
ncbi:MAG: IS21 family transposase [Gammaproteobacteria bacterium]|nr:IS21 family transposase [Gammaproteobacteria bacterium]